MGKGSKSKKRVTSKKINASKRREKAISALEKLLMATAIYNWKSSDRINNKKSIEKDAELLRNLRKTGGKKNKTQKKRKNKSNKK